MLEVVDMKEGNMYTLYPPLRFTSQVIETRRPRQAIRSPMKYSVGIAAYPTKESIRLEAGMGA